MIEIVSATRKTANEAQKTPLGQSISRLQTAFNLELALYAENSAGLPEVYNNEIGDGDDNAILVFVHDDVWIEDAYLDYTLENALRVFDVVGIAGSRRRLPRQETWCLSSVDPMVFDTQYLSGRIGHGAGPTGGVVRFGPVGVECQLLDGVLLAARRGTLRRAGVRFDERFTFHHYDIDFCRTATKAGLKLGTWTIPITHESVGSLDDRWRAAREVYLAKWPD